MAYTVNTEVKYRVQVSDLIDGVWKQVYRTGVARVIEYGFQMQLGDMGYNLEVISEDNGAYTKGITIRAYSHNVRI
jgi:hypothetical protein